MFPLGYIGELRCAMLFSKHWVWCYLTFLCVVCFHGCGDDDANVSVAADAATPSSDASEVISSTVTVATFNVRAFFDPVCDSRRCGPQSYESQPTQSEFDAKARQLALGIESLGADVVLLQEVESELCLSAIRDALGDNYPTAILGETNGIASLDVGVISKLPIMDTFLHRETAIPLVNRPGETYFVREFLEVHLDLAGDKLIVFNAHFKSKQDDDPEQRLAEASAARQIVTRRITEYPDALVVFGGDLNDVPGSTTLNAIESDGRLYRVAQELGTDAATYVYRGQGQAIDHLYLGRNAVSSYQNGSAQVVRNSPRGLAGSDHGGLVSTFLLQQTP